VPSAENVEQSIHATDRQRADFIRLFFGCNWNNPHLYHMLISSELGEETVAEIIIEAIQRGGEAKA
jgi:hypothetical protein